MSMRVREGFEEKALHTCSFLAGLPTACCALGIQQT